MHLVCPAAQTSHAYYTSSFRGQVALADEAIRIGPPPAVDSYLRGDVILEAAKRSGAQASTPSHDIVHLFFEWFPREFVQGALFSRVL